MMTSSSHGVDAPGTSAGSVSTTGQVLRACTRAHDWSGAPVGLLPLLENVDGHDLLAAARRHRVSGCVSASVRHLPGVLPPQVEAAFEADARTQLAEHMRALGVVVHLLKRALDPVLGPWGVVKGPVLSGFVYDRPDLRSYRDVDVLVRPEELGVAVTALEAEGCELLDRNWTLLQREMLGELHLLTPNGMVVDLHWSLHNRERLRRTFPAPTGELLDRGAEVLLAGSPVRTLDPLDTLVHLTLHAAMSGGDLLVWLKDIEQAWGHVEPDQLPDRVEEWRARLPVSAMLSRTARVLGLNIGELSPSLTLPRTVAGPLSAVEARWDFVTGGDTGSSSRLLTRALRRDAVSTFMETGRRAAAHLRHRGHDRRDRPDQPTSVLFDSGGPEGRRAYLEQVARWR